MEIPLDSVQVSLYPCAEEQNMAKPEILLTPKDISVRVGVTRQMVHLDIQAGRLTPDATAAGGMSLFKKATADRYVQDREATRKKA